MHRITVSSLVLLLASTTLSAQDDDADNNAPRVVELRVHPARPPRPALRYSLLPALRDQRPGNAQPLYTTAALMLTESAAAEIAEKWKEYRDTPPGELPRDALRTLLEKHPSVLRYATLAARRERCVWDVPIREVGIIEAILPSLAKNRALGRLLALEARLEIAEGRYDDAMQTLQVGMTLARNTAQGRTLIHGLVGADIARTMAEQLEALVQAPETPNLYWALTALPRPFVDLRDGLRTERALPYFSYPQLRTLASAPLTAEQSQALVDDLVRVLILANPEHSGHNKDQSMDAIKKQSAARVATSYPLARRNLLARGLAPDRVDAMSRPQVVLLAGLRGYERWRDDLFKWINVPYWQARESLARIEDAFEQPAAREESEPFHAFLPSVGRAYFTVTRLDRRLAALRTVEAVRLYAAAHDGALPASLADIDAIPIPTDPVTGQPILYRRDGDTAIIDLPAPPDLTPDHGDRYVITLAR